jgi:hypothetical protein
MDHLSCGNIPGGLAARIDPLAGACVAGVRALATRNRPGILLQITGLVEMAAAVQNILVAALVAWAVGFVGLRAWRTIRGFQGQRCGGCHKACDAAGREPAVVSIQPLKQAEAATRERA